LAGAGYRTNPSRDKSHVVITKEYKLHMRKCRKLILMISFGNSDKTNNTFLSSMPPLPDTIDGTSVLDQNIQDALLRICSAPIK